MGLLLFIIFAIQTITTAFQLDQSRTPASQVRSFKSQTRVGITQEKASLGEMLFFDKRLSIDGTVSCASCHDPAFAFAGRDTIATGANDQIGTRNTPTLLNAVFSKTYFWDGRSATLEEQAKQPLLHSSEMGMETEAALVQRLTSIDGYIPRFRRVFPRREISLETVAEAIAAYERTLLSRNSPFDRFINGDTTAITDSQKRGWGLFKDKAKCVDCHRFTLASPFFTDAQFHNTGIFAREQRFDELEQRAREISALSIKSVVQFAHRSDYSELGRFLVTRELSDIGAYKTPTLRDIELTWPYMHNGSIRTLLDVVKFYNRGGNQNPHLDPKLRPLNLTEEEMSDVVEFMRALTSDEVLRMVQSSTPQERIRISTQP